MATLQQFLERLNGGGASQPAAPLPPEAPSGHVNAGGIMVPSGAPLPGQLGSPSNPLTKAQMETLNAPNPASVAPALPSMGLEGIMNSPVGPQPANPGTTPQPMSNLAFALGGSVPQQQPLKAGGNFGSYKLADHPALAQALGI